MSMYELIVIAVVALIVFGPDKLPELAYRVAKYWKAWQGMYDDVTKQINQQIHIQELTENKNKILDNMDKVIEETNKTKEGKS